MGIVRGLVEIIYTMIWAGNPYLIGFGTEDFVCFTKYVIMKLRSTCVIIYLLVERSTTICVTQNIYSFFPYRVSEWEKLSDEVKASTTVGQFPKYLVSNIRPPERSMHGIFDISGIKLLTKLRVEFSF